MIKKRCKLGIRILSAGLLLGTLASSSSSSAFAGSWSTNLGRWSSDSQISELRKNTNVSNYYMEISSVGGDYDSVEHWIEGNYGGNYSKHTITKEGENDSPKSDADNGDDVTLNVCNPINTRVKVFASGAWSPN